MLIQIKIEGVAQKERDNAPGADGGDEGERQRHACKIGGDAREGHQGRPHKFGQAAQHDGIGQQEAKQPATDRRRGADLDADPVGRQDVRFKQCAEVVEGKLAVGALKTARNDGPRGEKQKGQSEYEEGHDAQPNPGNVACARHGTRLRRVPCFRRKR